MAKQNKKKPEAKKLEEIAPMAPTPEKSESKAFVGLKGEPSSYREVADKKIASAPIEAPTPKEPEPAPRPATLINKMNHNITISYDGEALVIPPHGRAPIGDCFKLGALPRGLVLIPAPKKI